MNDVKSVLNVYFDGNNYGNVVTINQYDSGVKIKFADLELPDTYEVIFGIDPKSHDGVPMIGGPAGVEIPYDLTRRGCDIYCWPVYRLEDGAVMTKHCVRISVARRSGVDPGRGIGTVATPSAADQLLNAVNDAVEIGKFHSPYVENGTWHVWGNESNQYIDTELPAAAPDDQYTNGDSNMFLFLIEAICLALVQPWLFRNKEQNIIESATEHRNPVM